MFDSTENSRALTSLVMATIEACTAKGYGRAAREIATEQRCADESCPLSNAQFTLYSGKSMTEAK